MSLPESPAPPQGAQAAQSAQGAQAAQAAGLRPQAVQPVAEPENASTPLIEIDPYAERLAALQADNHRLRNMLAAAGRLAEFGRFAAKQNHELRQPLFAIKGLAQLLLDRDQINVEEVRDFARHIVEQAERLTGLVSNLRQVSIPAPQTGESVVDVPPILLRVASLLDWRFRKGVTLRTEIAADLPPVAVSPHQLEQMLINLLSNALDALAGKPKPIIQVRINMMPRLSPAGEGRSGSPDAPGGDALEIAVADNGHGVPRTARGRLFDNFFTTKGEEDGTGLGLAVSREIARGAGGDLELLDAPGRWAEPAVTAFRLILPLADDRKLP